MGPASDNRTLSDAAPRTAPRRRPSSQGSRPRRVSGWRSRRQKQCAAPCILRPVAPWDELRTPRYALQHVRAVAARIRTHGTWSLL